MFYVLGVAEDEKNHLKYCRNRQLLDIDSISIQSLRHLWQGHTYQLHAGENNKPIQVAWENIELGVQIIRVSTVLR